MKLDTAGMGSPARRSVGGRRGCRRGALTLEIAIAAGIFGFLATGGLALTLGAAKGWDTGTGKSESDTQASLALQKIAREVTDAKSAVASQNGAQLTVQMPWLNDQGCYDRAFDGDEVTFYVSNGNLYRRVNGGTGVILTRDIGTPNFSVTGGMVNLVLRSRVTAGRHESETEFSQAVTLRNHEAE
jgi:hypothetical protein